MNPTPLICRSSVKQYTLDVLAANRPALKDKLTRVSGEFYILMEARLRQAIVSHINTLPSMGKTVR